ncbi:MAG: coenzyme F420-0:L-glutamate ligase [Caldilineaceae bacterium]
MHIQPIHTEIIPLDERDLFRVLDAHVTEFATNSVLAITSKIIAICQGRIVRSDTVNRQQCIEAESDRFLPPTASRYGVTLTIKNHLLSANAGIDESNGDGFYILWPEQPQQVANQIRHYLCQRFAIQHAGVVITDSSPIMMRWGVNGVAIAHSGFAALNDYVGKPDLFGRPLRMTRVNVANALAVAAVLVMGEGDESTPLAVIHDLPFVHFQNRNPRPEELAALQIDPQDDLYAPLLTSVPWQRGHSSFTP